MTIKPLIQSLIACGLLSTAFVVNADLTIIGKNGNEHLLSENFMKIPGDEESKRIGILKIDSETITTVDEQHKLYYQTTVDEMCAFTSNIIADLKSKSDQVNKEIMARFTKEQRQKMQGLNDPEVITIKMSNTNVNVAGYSTTEYKVYQDNDLMEVLWLSTDKKLVKAYSHVITLQEKIKCAFNQQSHYSNDLAYKALVSKGIILKSYSGRGSEIYEDDVEEYFSNQHNEYSDEIHTFEAVKVSFNNIPNSKFNIPKEYKSVTLEELLNAQNEPLISDSFNKSLVEKYATEQPENIIEEEINKVEEPTVNEVTEEVEEISKKQKAIDKLKEVAEEKGGAVGKLLGKLF